MMFLVSLMIIVLVAAVSLSEAFAPLQLRDRRIMISSTSSTNLEMGIFDGFKKAFTNEEYGDAPDAVKATARHILVKTLDDVAVVMDKLASGSTFGSLASEYSTCPASGSRGGSLGSFSPGTMVAEFDKVIFSPDTKIGVVIGPVGTKFGYHLIVVDKRTGGGDWY
jgi:peptidyl-prolyl cis-trans isomerase C